jgi:5-methylthioadenosine/S-adenosylhomocysteine deaminase
VSPEFVHEGAQHACAEMLRAGVTCFNDMYFFPGAAARAAREAGMRHTAGLIVIEFPSAYAGSAQEYIEKGLALHDELRDDPLISTAFAPHAPYTVSDATLAHVRTLADELDIPVHMHVHETRDEIEGSLKEHGVRPLERLRRLGLLNPALLAVHMTQLTDAEIAQVAEAGASVAHCPQSNLKLASGYCPVQRLLSAGVNVALGTDGAASNNDLDLLNEMQTAALLAKAVAQDAAALPAAQALHLATLGGARALGLGEITGSLTAGKWADITAINLADISTQPLYHPLSQIVYAAARHQVSHVWVAGRALLHEGRLTTLDEAGLLARAAAWQPRLLPQA